MSSDLDSIFDPNPNELDREWIEQPSLFLKYATKLADARKAHSEAKAAMDVKEAELKLAIRMAPGDFDLEKVTEGAINDTVQTRPGFKKKVQETIDAKHLVDTLDATVTALDQRKKALENLVTLHGQSYFASPRAKTEDDQERMSNVEKKALMNRTKKKGKEE